MNCSYCGDPLNKTSSEIGRAKRIGANLYCGRKCAGLGRRKPELSMTEKKEAKRLYDIEYRAKNGEILKAKKQDYFKRTYDPVKAAIERKKIMPRHIEYCRRPEYKVKKQKYDEVYRAKKVYGEFWEAFLLIQNLGKEVDSRITKQEIAGINGTRNKSQTRRRNYESTHSNKS